MEQQNSLVNRSENQRSHSCCLPHQERPPPVQRTSLPPLAPPPSLLPTFSRISSVLDRGMETAIDPTGHMFQTPTKRKGPLLFARPSLDALREENEDALLAFTVRCTVAEKLWKGKELKNDRVCVETLIRLVDAVISLSLERPKGWM
jgi:hypothetical protein